MSIQKFIRISAYLLGTFLIASCNSPGNGSKLPPILPDVITEKTPHDTDDPAIWVHPTDPSKSIVFGTDKDTDGGIYAFDLQGKIMKEKSITGIQRPNNIDVAYGFSLNDSIQTDMIAFTERERQQIRIYSVPEMKPLDHGGFSVFEDEQILENKLPMGIAFYRSPIHSTFYTIVSRKTGPKEGYLYQYKLSVDKGKIQHQFVRKFGKFSGKKEVEAIAIDAELGYIYYSDEGACIRKYHAEPSMGNDEISCFGGEHFKGDLEGIAIIKGENNNGYLVVSDQQRGQFNLFDRKSNQFVKAINLNTYSTDGCDAVNTALNTTFINGLFVAMNEDKNFYFYDLKKLVD